MSAGSWQHYLPASYLGAFAFGSANRARERALWVARRGKSTPYLQKVANVAAQHDIYTLRQPGPGSREPLFVDRVWTHVERTIASAIEHLVSAPADEIAAAIWVRTLTHFAAHVLVRGVDFAPRYLQRLRRQFMGAPSALVDSFVAGSADSDSVNHARLFELQRLLGAVFLAEWEVVHAPPDVPLITTDVGRAASRMPDGRLMVAIPLRPDAALVLRKGERRPLFFPASPTEWNVAPILHFPLSSRDAAGLNRALAAQALSECYTSTQQQAVRAHQEMGATAPRVELGEPIFFGESSRDYAEHELLYMKAISFIAEPPAVRVHDPALPEEIRTTWRQQLGL